MLPPLPQRVPRGPAPRRRWRAPAPLAAVLALAVGCDYPTGIPRFTSTFVIPGDSTTIQVDTLLPDAVDVVTSGGSRVFALTLAEVTFSRSLGELCGCSGSSSVPVPKPAFGPSSFGSSIALPANLVSASIAGGGITVQVTNGFSFDPIRPSADPAKPRGSLKLELSSGGTALGSVTIDGATEAFPSGATLTRTLTLAAATIRHPVDVRITIFSPEGDAVTFDTDQRITVRATPGQILVSQAEVRVQDKTIGAQQTTLDLAGVDDALIRRVQGGALRLSVANPFGVQGTLEVRITPPGGAAIVKSIALAVGPGTTTESVAMTRDELRGILGKDDVVLTASGTVSAPSGVVTVLPTQVVRIATQLELTLSSTED